MIVSGAFSQSVDVDLLGDLDLDLDFLNVHEDDELVFGNMDDMVGHDTAHEQEKRVGKILSPTTLKSEYLHHSRGGTLGGTDEIGAVSETARNHNTHDKPRSQSNAGEHAYEVNRMRTNSLALPGMMLDGASQDYSLGDFGHWMDSDLPNLVNNSSARQLPSHDDVAMINVDGSSSSFKLQCDLLMQKEGDHCFASSPALVRSILMDEPIKPKKVESQKKQHSSGNPKKDKTKKSPRKPESNDGKKSKKKVSSPNEAYSTKTIPFIQREKTGDDEEDNKKEVQSGLGKPRSMSDPNLTVRLDDFGLLHVDGPKGWVGAYSPNSREIRINRFLEKRNHRVWVKKVVSTNDLLTHQSIEQRG